MPPERRNQEASSGAGELSDSMSVGEVGVSHIRKKKSRVRKPLLMCVWNGYVVFLCDVNISCMIIKIFFASRSEG